MTAFIKKFGSLEFFKNDIPWLSSKHKLLTRLSVKSSVSKSKMKAVHTCVSKVVLTVDWKISQKVEVKVGITIMWRLNCKCALCRSIGKDVYVEKQIFSLSLVWLDGPIGESNVVHD